MSASVIQYVVPAVAALAGGGGITALFKARPEGSKIVVDAAEGAVVVQTGVITSLREELARYRTDLGTAQQQIAEMRAHLNEVTSLRRENAALREENATLRNAQAALTRRVGELEAAQAHD